MPDRVVIVTGASSGIGRALSLEAAREGFAVVLVARRADRLLELSRAIIDAGGKCTSVVADVRSADAPRRIVAAALEAFGRIDVVVNNAGSGAHGALLEESDDAIDAQWQMHVAGPLRIARAALPALRETHGQLVFVGSGIARVPIPLYGAYAPAKAAIRAAAIQLRRELRAEGIAVTYVDPGLVATEFHAAIGIERATEVPAAPPERVARAILRGIHRRSATVHGTPWQTFGTMIGEWAGTLADPTLVKMAPAKVAAAPQPQPGPAPSPPPPAAPPAAAAAAGGTPFEAALEPVARRMERVKLPESFLRAALVPGTELELNEVAMRWAGMPNKNERAAMHEVLGALAAAGYLQPTGDESWKVVRAAE